MRGPSRSSDSRKVAGVEHKGYLPLRTSSAIGHSRSGISGAMSAMDDRSHVNPSVAAAVAAAEAAALAARSNERHHIPLYSPHRSPSPPRARTAVSRARTARTAMSRARSPSPILLSASAFVDGGDFVSIAQSAVSVTVLDSADATTAVVPSGPAQASSVVTAGAVLMQTFDHELIRLSETLLHLLFASLTQAELCVVSLVCKKWRIVARRLIRRLAFNRPYATYIQRAAEWPRDGYVAPLVNLAFSAGAGTTTTAVAVAATGTPASRQTAVRGRSVSPMATVTTTGTAGRATLGAGAGAHRLGQPTLNLASAVAPNVPPAVIIVRSDTIREAAAAFPFVTSVSLAGCSITDGVVETLERFAKLAAVDLTNARGVQGERLPEMLSTAPTLRQIKISNIPMGDMSLAELLFAASRLELLEIGGRNTSLSSEGARSLARQCLRLRVVALYSMPLEADALETLVCESKSLERLRLAFLDLDYVTLESTTLAAIDVRHCAQLQRIDATLCPALRELSVAVTPVAKTARESLKGCGLVRRLALCAAEFNTSSIRRSLRLLQALRELVLRTLPAITEDVFGEELQRCRYLHTLIVEDCVAIKGVCPPPLPYVETVMLSDLPSVTEIRLHAPRLQTLKCSHNASLTNFALLEPTPHLTSLDLSYCSALSTESFVTLIDFMASVRTLTLSGTSVVDDALSLLVSRCPLLTSLTAVDCFNLRDTHIESESLVSLDLSLCSHLQRLTCVASTLRDLTISGCLHLSRLHLCAPETEKLVLARCPRLTDAAVTLELGSRLQSFVLDGCSGMRALSFAHPTVKIISARGCSGVEQMTLNCAAAYRVDLYGCGNLVDLSLGCPLIEDLSLAYCNKMTSLIALTKTCSSIRSLDIRGTGSGYRSLSDAVLQRTVQQLPWLGTLDVSDNARLQYVRLQSTALHTLYMDRCEALKDLQLVCPALGVLSLQQCTLPPSCIATMLLRSCPSLRVLDLTGAALDSAETQHLVKLYHPEPLDVRYPGSRPPPSEHPTCYSSVRDRS